MHSVVALALPRVVAFDLAIPAQIFGHEDEADDYTFTLCAPAAGPVASTTGFDVIAPAGLEALRHADTVIVPGFVAGTGHGDDALGSDGLPGEVLDALRSAHARGTRTVSICTGAFALAAAGLLDGRRATTHWRNAAALQQQFPSVEVDPGVLYIDDGQIATSAGIAAGIDLCLNLVRSDRGEAVASRIARRMVVAPHREGGQAQFIENPLPEAGGFGALCAWVLDHLGDELTIPQLARRAGWAPRSFTRRFLAETGTTPLRWISSQRLARARELLERTDLTIDDVSAACGLGSAANLRAHFLRASGTTPSNYRRTFAGAR